MEVTETKEELAEMALRVSPQLINLKDIYAANYIFSAGYYAEDAADWGRARFGAMMTYAAGYIAGIRAERRKRKEKAARHADAERFNGDKSIMNNNLDVFILPQKGDNSNEKAKI